jgi:hypothetical protein
VILAIRVWLRNRIEWPSRRRFLAMKMRDLGLAPPKWWHSNRRRSLTIMMFLSFPRDISSRSGLRRYVAWILGIDPHRVEVYESPGFAVIKVPRSTSPAAMVAVATALDREVPHHLQFRVERGE